ncbi:MAG: hypothetical protein AB1465_04560 [Patescibacteria group bacterium]
MKNKKYCYVGSVIFVLVLGFFALVGPGKAFAALQATLSSASPTDVTDISDRIPAKTPGELLKAYSYTSDIGTTYTFVFDLANDDGTPVTRQPFLINVGSKVTAYTYDSTTQKLTITVVTQIWYPPKATNPEKEIVFVILPTIESTKPGEGEGPPHAMAGGYVSTTVLDFRILPPEKGEPGFGLSLSGAPGTSGFFNMLMPKTMFDFMSQQTGKTITPKDLAIFIDNQQASVSVTDLNGAAFIDITITFSSGNTTTGAALGMAATVTKEIVAKEKLPLSLAVKKATLKKNKKAKLYGWLESGKKGKEVTILKKKKGEKEFTKIATVATKKHGYFYYKFKAAEKGKYFYKAQFKKKKSSKAALKVK